MKVELEAKAVAILSACPDLAIATVREDGFPQNTTVSFVHDGLSIFIGVGESSQKAANLRRDPRASLTLTAPYDDWSDIRGLSMAAHASEMTTEAEIAEVGRLMLKRFPEIAEMDRPDDIGAAFFRFSPTVISVLDYTLGFGHADTFKIDEHDIAETLESMQHKWLIPVQ